MFLDLAAQGEIIATIKVELDELVNGITFADAAYDPTSIDCLDSEAMLDMEKYEVSFFSHDGERRYTQKVAAISPWLTEMLLAA